MKYLKFKTIKEIYNYPNLRAKYNITEAQYKVETLLKQHIVEGKLTLPKRPAHTSKKKFDRELNITKLEYLKSLPEVTDDMIDYFKVNYIDNNALHYNSLSHKYNHIIVFNKEQDWVRTIHSSRNNSVSTDGIKGILTIHNDEYVFITKTSVFKCSPTGNIIYNKKEVELNELLISLI